MTFRGSVDCIAFLLGDALGGRGCPGRGPDAKSEDLSGESRAAGVCQNLSGYYGIMGHGYNLSETSDDV